MLIKKPEVFHGNHKKRPYFEGWYHKMSLENGKSLVLIPGMYRSAQINYETAFLMIYNGISNNFKYLKYSIDSFRCKKNSYHLELEDSFFSLEKIILKIDNDDLKMNGEIFCSDLNPWPFKLLEPGCMGWYGYLPTMECFHGILSMDHKLKGALSIDDKKISFNNGRGYIEKDWGRNFPQNWFWTQGNNFNDSTLSLSASLATIPWRSRQFTGFIIGLNTKDRMYRFTPYRNSKIIKATFNDKKFLIVVKRKNLTLKIESTIGEMCSTLYAPDKKDMVPKVDEYLDSNVSIQLIEGENILIRDKCSNAALEIIGDMKVLLKDL